jgi:hypothetical protein
VGFARLKRSLKRKGVGVGVPRARRLAWLCIESSGEKSFMHVDKRALISKVGLSIPIRDMRLLDQNLAIGDSVILVRENAIIASLEHVRIIIMYDKVLIPREGLEQSEQAGNFVDMLDDAIQEWVREKAHFEDRVLRQTLYTPSNENSAPQEHEKYDETSSMSDMAQDIEPLPFELVVLEAALKEVIGSISLKTSDIEQVTMPTMDALMKAVTPGNLECVRKVKTRLQRITGRCEAVRDELERFLQDDDDMDRMCLTRKKEIEDEFLTKQFSLSSRAMAEWNDDEDKGGVQQPSSSWNKGSTRPMAVPVIPSLSSHRRGFLTRQSLSFNPREPSPMANQNNGNNVTQEDDPEADSDAHLEVENLLESYFMQVDAIHDKLVSLGAYIQDSEEFINIELDSSRNRLIRFEIILSVATFAIMPFNIISGMLGENLILPDLILGDVSRFFAVNLASACVSCLIFAIIYTYMSRYKVI